MVPDKYPEKLIPMTIKSALAGRTIPIYGDGQQIRDWIYVGDHANALRLVARDGVIGETYNIGGETEISNIKLVEKICAILDKTSKSTMPNGLSHSNLIRFVTDRPGHDRRYGLDISKIKAELNWRPEMQIDDGLIETVKWYQTIF
jgi:dTDP-glucose 4,6-dehydratase